jgi:hypothetical protein
MSVRERIKSSDVKEILNEVSTVTDVNNEDDDSEHKRRPSVDNQQSPIKYTYYAINEDGEEQTMDSMSLSLFKYNKTLKSKIIKDILAPSYVSEIKEAIRGRKTWKITADAFLTSSKIATLFSTIFAFSASTYDNKTLSFTAGIIGCIAGAFMQFYHFAKGEANSKTLYENNLLSNLGITNFIIDVDKTNEHETDDDMDHHKKNITKHDNVVKKKSPNDKLHHNNLQNDTQSNNPHFKIDIDE